MTELLQLQGQVTDQARLILAAVKRLPIATYQYNPAVLGDKLQAVLPQDCVTESVSIVIEGAQSSDRLGG
jgi:hypothetical protein